MIRHLLLFCLLIYTANGAGNLPGPPLQHKWLTLHGDHPLVVANGGLSGLFPDSSYAAFVSGPPEALIGSPMLCELKISKDGDGYCLSKLVLQNTTTVADLYPNASKTYDVNGVKVTGWFGIDFDGSTLFSNVTLFQNQYSRPDSFDNSYAITPAASLMGLGEGALKPPLWINVEYDMFYKQHKLSVESYLINDLIPLKLGIAFISSPEIGFLKSIGPKVRGDRIKLYLKFPTDKSALEPSTKQKYESILKQLPMIKGFAAGIVVPRHFIWPVDENRYLEPATTLVADAHRQGLEVFAYNFANDNYFSYNYSLDPVNEYLQFIDNSKFSVDGVITDFCSTASNAIACLAHHKNGPRVLKKLIISHNGASGKYAGGTDLAYQQAVNDGADIIDCKVQLSKDGVAFCQNSPDLKFTTTAGTTMLDRFEEIPEFNGGQAGVFSFHLTWEEIQSLKPKIYSPYPPPLDRNHGYQFAGKIVTLPEFLELAKAKSVLGVMLGVQNAAYLATKGHDLIGTVTSALRNASLDKQTKQKVMISSDETAVLSHFKKNNANYERVLDLKDDFSSVPPNLPAEIKKFADSVSIPRSSIVLEYTEPFFMTKTFSNAVKAMHSANLSVYVSKTNNEFQSILFDYNSDPYQEFATLVSTGVDGFITEFPSTVSAYMRSPCSDLKKQLEYTISPIVPGDMFNNIVTQVPFFDKSRVNKTVNPPLSSKFYVSEPILSVSKPESNNAESPDASAPPKDSSSTRVTATNTVIFLVALAGILATLYS